MTIEIVKVENLPAAVYFPDDPQMVNIVFRIGPRSLSEDDLYRVISVHHIFWDVIPEDVKEKCLNDLNQAFLQEQYQCVSAMVVEE